MAVQEPAELSAETRRANARLRAALARVDRDFALAKALVRAAQPPVPAVSPGVTVEVKHTPGHPTGTDWWAASRVSSTVRVVLSDAAGPATPAGAAMPLFIRALAGRDTDCSPGKLLAAVNRELIALALDDPPVVAMTALNLDAAVGQFVVARAGSPRPVVETADGLPVELTLSGPLLGLFDAANFPEHTGALRRGEAVILSTDGAVEESDDSTRIVVRYDTCG